MDKQSFLLLVDKVVNGTASEEELLLYNRYYNHFRQEEEEGAFTDPALQQETGNLILERIHRSIGVRKIPLYNRTWVRAAAAALIVMAGSWLYVKYNKPGRTDPAVVASGNGEAPVPGSNQAVLTLADGNTIALNDAQNGTIAKQGNTQVLKLKDGQLAYNTAHGVTHPVTMNMLTTPYGGQYQVQLPDGSMVWLNAGSSLRYPTAFTGNERNVELTGEAYFEVAKDAAHPFKVKIRDMEVAVYGTHFNIMGYDDEGAVKTSLLTGSVGVRRNKDSVKLVPGQQSGLNANGQLTVQDHANMAQAVAWKNGLFDFDGADMHAVMRQLSRWYNTEVVYEGSSDQHFTGKISREADLVKVLQMLEMTEKVHFRITGRKIIVTPVNNTNSNK